MATITVRNGVDVDRLVQTIGARGRRLVNRRTIPALAVSVAPERARVRTASPARVKEYAPALYERM